MTIRTAILLSALCVFLIACKSLEQKQNRLAKDTQTQFFNNLKKTCGTRFEGQMTYPENGQDSFAGKVLVAHIKECSNTEIRIPFDVGEDKSRTWIISTASSGLELKHDHRLADGTPDEINMYGGLAKHDGNSLSQAFYADMHTATIIPAAATNVWTLTLSEDNKTLTYYLERDSAPRFKAVLQRVLE